MKRKCLLTLLLVVSIVLTGCLGYEYTPNNPKPKEPEPGYVAIKTFRESEPRFGAPARVSLVAVQGSYHEVRYTENIWVAHIAIFDKVPPNKEYYVYVHDINWTELYAFDRVWVGEDAVVELSYIIPYIY